VSAAFSDIIQDRIIELLYPTSYPLHSLMTVAVTLSWHLPPPLLGPKFIPVHGAETGRNISHHIGVC
jgi:hypothetical protein